MPDPEPDKPAADPYRATTRAELEDAGAEPRAWTITTDQRPRLDVWLQNRIGGMSRAQVQKLIAMEGARVNGKPSKPSQRLREGDAVTVLVPPKPQVDLRPEPIPLDVLYEDPHLIAINKAAGIIVHPARKYLSGTMLNALAHHFQAQRSGELSGVGEADARPGVVHRLDMNTTGVILFAKQDATHWLLARQFEHRTNDKRYLAIVHGVPDPLSGALDFPLGKHPTIREAHAVRNDDHGRDSLTLYRVRRIYDGYSLVELELKTGRTHQIRVHLSYVGHPIIGDVMYGGCAVGEAELADPPLAPGARPNLVYAATKSEGQAHEASVAERQAAGEPFVFGTPALHAAYMQFTHPETDERMTIQAPPPPNFIDLVRRLEAGGGRPGIDDGTKVGLDWIQAATARRGDA